jgi:hypothetical protein
MVVNTSEAKRLRSYQPVELRVYSVSTGIIGAAR